jgi:putative hydrolase of the HAD superfamily
VISPHVPPAFPLPGAPMIWSDEQMRPHMAGDGSATRLRRRLRGGLIVDLDDTLYPREHFVRSGLAAVARHVALTRGVCIDTALNTLSSAYDQGVRSRELQALCRTFDLPFDIIPELVAVFREHEPSVTLAADVIATLQALRQDGWRIAVLTNGLPSVQASKVSALELARYVDHVLYAECYAHGGKPAPAAFHAALKRLQLPASSCICVGDDPICDVRGARQLGIHTVRVARADVHVSPEHDADAVVERFADLPAAAVSLLELVNADVA